MKVLSEKHRKMILEYVLSNGDIKGVAERHDVSSQALKQLILKDTLFKDEINRIRNTVEDVAIAQWRASMEPIYKDLKNLATNLVHLAHNANTDSVKVSATTKAMQLARAASTKEEADKVRVQRVELRVETPEKQETPKLTLIEEKQGGEE